MPVDSEKTLGRSYPYRRRGTRQRTGAQHNFLGRGQAPSGILCSERSRAVFPEAGGALVSRYCPKSAEPARSTGPVPGRGAASTVNCARAPAARRTRPRALFSAASGVGVCR